MEPPPEQLPSTEAAVIAIREIAREFELTVRVTDDIGADRSARRTAAGAFAVTDEDGSLPHEAHAELSGSPAVEVELYSEGDAKVTVEGVEFHDLPRDVVPDFLRSVYGGAAHVKGRFFPPGYWLVVPLPGGRALKELVLSGPVLSPWLSRSVR
ncbi:hypothetical protein DMH02_003380 [Streptomyces sp. WAC 00631]|uniref:hypothetical protein n=1 Tax=unclassified Streptomyces TaxID=2593676 RepID=UPI000F7AEBB4|nr:MULTISPECIES: hypothetical protein [unclassified Streptomyces]MCC5032318.1 hypothetical protein [Streptomyces sp. WAC 00631]MCC9740428.1 hypothetical protein [Streptomyces sp. MNU89]